MQKHLVQAFLSLVGSVLVLQVCLRMIYGALELAITSEVLFDDTVIERILRVVKLEELLLGVLHLGKSRNFVLPVWIAYKVETVAPHDDLLHDLADLASELLRKLGCDLTRLYQVMPAIADKGVDAAFGKNLRNLLAVTLGNGLVEPQNILVTEPKEAKTLVDITANDKWALLAGRK